MTEGHPLLRLIYRLSIAIGVFMVHAVIFSLVAEFLCQKWYHVQINDVIQSADITNASAQDIRALRFFQGFVSFGTFLVSALVITLIFREKPAEYLGLKKTPTLYQTVFLLLLLWVSVPALNGLLELNRSVQLPESMNRLALYFKNLEAKSDRIYETMLHMPGLSDLCTNILVMALIPALGEEFFCRGVLLNLFFDYTGTFLRSVFWVAVIFTLLHLQFYKVIPMMAMAFLLGMWINWTSGIWASVLFHFLNNCMAVLSRYFYQRGYVNYLTDENIRYPYWLILLSFAVVLLIIYMLHRNHQSKLTIQHE